MTVGTCVYSEQAESPLLLTAIQEGRVGIVRQMYEVDKDQASIAALNKLLEVAQPAGCQVHVCFWNGNPNTPPPEDAESIPLAGLSVDSVGIWNETDLRYGWAEYPVRTFADYFRGNQAVTNYPYGWNERWWDPFTGSARWNLGLQEYVDRMAALPVSNSGGLTKDLWVRGAAWAVDVVDLHLYGSGDLVQTAQIQLATWDSAAGEELPFFVGELGPHSTHQEVWEPEKNAEWLLDYDRRLTEAFGERYLGACWHGPNHLEMLSYLPVSATGEPNFQP